MAHSMNRNAYRWLLALVLLAAPLFAADADARRKRVPPVHVAADGLDTTVCGDPGAACRSITRGILQARAWGRRTVLVGPGLYGDVDYDGDFNDWGDETIPLDVDAIHVVSTHGAARTVVKVKGTIRELARVWRGGHIQGFTLQGGRSYGLTVFGGGTASNIVTTRNFQGAFVGRDGFVQGVVAVRNGRQGFVVQGGHVVDSFAIANLFSGFHAVIPGSVVQRCQSIRNGVHGFELPPSAPPGAFSGNMALANRQSGFLGRRFTSSSNYLTGNLASANGQHGFVLDGESHILTGNMATANLGYGVVANGTDGQLDRQRSIGNYLGGLSLGPGTTRVDRSAFYGNSPCQVRFGDPRRLEMETTYLGAAARCRGFFPQTLAASESSALSIKKAKKKKRKRKKQRQRGASWPVQP